jgi:hypothetical protein
VTDADYLSLIRAFAAVLAAVVIEGWRIWI